MNVEERRDKYNILTPERFLLKSVLCVKRRCEDAAVGGEECASGCSVRRVGSLGTAGVLDQDICPRRESNNNHLVEAGGRRR